MKGFLCLLILFLSINLQSQSSIGNLKNKLNATQEKEKATKLDKICNYYNDRNWDSLTYYANALLEVSQNINYEKGKIKGFIYLGKALDAKADFINSKKNYNLAISSSTKDTLLLINSLEGLGKLYLNNDKLDSANLIFNKAIRIANLSKNEKKVKELSLNKGFISCEKTEYKQSIEILLTDYEYFLDNNDQKSLFEINNGIGNAYFELCDLDNAKKYYTKALQTAQVLDNPVKIGRSYGNLANTYGNMQKFDSCLIFMLQSYKYFKESGDKHRTNLVRNNLLNLYALTGKYEQLLELSEELMKESLSPKQEIILLHSKSRALFHLGRTEESMDVLDKAIDIAQNLDSEQSLFKLYTTSIDQYLEQNDPRLLIFFRKYDSILNSRFDRENKEIITELNAKYDLKEKDAKLVATQLNVQKQKTYKYAAVGGILFLLFIFGVGIIYRNQIQKEKELYKAKELSELQKNMTQLGLSNLNNQIDSHDFKNTMSSILNEVQEKAPDSYQRIVGLLNITEAALYSDSFTDSLSNQFVQIKGLVSLAQHQIFEEIELDINNNIDTDVQIPRLLLKNLVENAIKHGIKGTNIKGHISIKTYKEDGYYILKVLDNGRGFQKDVNSGKGISVYKDMFTYFNERNENDAKIEFKAQEKGVEAFIQIPVDYKYS